jgi:hypothetical protein
MVSGRKNRLQIRRIDFLAIALAAVIGGFLPPGTLTADGARMLVTFLGLVAASIMPAITLLVGSLTSGGRSVLAIQNLDRELQVAIDALFLLFGCVCIIVLCLVALNTPPIAMLKVIPHLTSEILPRLGQVFVVAISSLILIRIGMIPAIIRRVLEIRTQNAVEEARRKIMEMAPDSAKIRQSFETKAEFGKTINLEDIPRNPH